VTVTLLKPAGANDVPPKAMFVVPSVMLLLVRALLGMLESVFVEPLMDLLVSVCVPVKVATVLSIATVTGADPL
jgi:hypothetical protein